MNKQRSTPSELGLLFSSHSCCFCWKTKLRSQLSSGLRQMFTGSLDKRQSESLTDCQRCCLSCRGTLKVLQSCLRPLGSLPWRTNYCCLSSFFTKDWLVSAESEEQLQFHILPTPHIPHPISLSVCRRNAINWICHFQFDTFHYLLIWILC